MTFAKFVNYFSRLIPVRVKHERRCTAPIPMMNPSIRSRTCCSMPSSPRPTKTKSFAQRFHSPNPRPTSTKGSPKHRSGSSTPTGRWGGVLLRLRALSWNQGSKATPEGIQESQRPTTVPSSPGCATHYLVEARSKKQCVGCNSPVGDQNLAKYSAPMKRSKSTSGQSKGPLSNPLFESSFLKDQYKIEQVLQEFERRHQLSKSISFDAAGSSDARRTTSGLQSALINFSLVPVTHKLSTPEFTHVSRLVKPVAYDDIDDDPVAFLRRKISKLKLFPRQKSQSVEENPDEQVEMDPIYELLKQAKHLSKPSGSRTASPNIPNIVTDSQSPARSGAASKEDSASSGIQSRRSSGSNNGSSQTQLANQRENGGTSNFLRTDCNITSTRHSAPQLCNLKTPSVDSQGSDNSDVPQNSTPAPVRNRSGPSPRRVKLDARMKSMSLDTEPNVAANMYYPLKPTRTIHHSQSPLYKRRTAAIYRSKPKFSINYRNHSYDHADEATTSTNSGSPCISPNVGSHTSLHPPSPNINSYVVMRDYTKCYPEELDLKAGQRLTIREQMDRDWLQGVMMDGRIGFFPAACIAPMYLDERVVQVNENIDLCDGDKSLRLYRDEIVFGIYESDEGMMMKIRTEKYYRALCPKRYLRYVE